MYSVVQFIEKQKFKVMAVPSGWVRKNLLFWPKLPNVKIEALRVSGDEYDGPTKKIPVIVFKKFKKLHLAEEAAEELSKREVSDVDNKRKRLKPTKKPKIASLKDYNLMVQDCGRAKRKVLSETNENSAAELGKSKAHPQATLLGPVDDVPAENFHLSEPVHTKASITKASSTLAHQNVSSSQNPTEAAFVQPNVRSPFTNTPTTSNAAAAAAAELMHANGHFQHPAVATMQLVQPIPTPSQHSYSDSVELPSSVQPLEAYSQVPMDQPHITTKMLTGLSPTQPIYMDQDEVMYYTPADENDTMSNLQIAGAMSYEQMKADLKVFIETTVEKVVEKSFQTNFARYAALSEIQRRDDYAQPQPADTVERHARINTEEELIEWNIKLNSKELCQRYLEYFSKIIIPNAYNDKGDNACYTIVDCLFTRDFWTKMTWTGINRGNKAKRGFREYGNVTQLLCSIVQIGDPSYTANKLEMFCRNRLFRYCKSRSTNRQLRKSACRKRRGHKSQASTLDVAHDEITQNSNESDDSESVEQEAEYSSDGSDVDSVEETSESSDGESENGSSTEDD